MSEQLLRAERGTSINSYFEALGDLNWIASKSAEAPPATVLELGRDMGCGSFQGTHVLFEIFPLSKRHPGSNGIDGVDGRYPGGIDGVEIGIPMLIPHNGAEDGLVI